MQLIFLQRLKKLCKLIILLLSCLIIQPQLQKRLIKQVLRLQQMQRQRRPCAHFQNASSSLDVGVLGCQKISYRDPRSRSNLLLQLPVRALIFLSNHLLYRKPMDLLNQKVHKDQPRLSLLLRKLIHICLLHLICQNPCSHLAELRNQQIPLENSN